MNENKDVLRVVTDTKANLEATLKTTQLGFTAENSSLGFKSPSGMKFYAADGGHANYQDMILAGLAGAGTRNVGVDGNGKLIISNTGSIGDAPADGELYGRKDNAWSKVDGNSIQYETGFKDTSGLIVEFEVVNDIPKITLKNIFAEDVTYYSDGNDFIINGSSEMVYEPSTAPLEGEYYLTLDESNNFKLTSSKSALTKYCSVGIFYWDADNNQYTYKFSLLHKAMMSTDSKAFVNNTIGATVNKGFDNLRLMNFNFGIGDNDNDYKFNYNEGIYHNCDISSYLPTSITTAPVFYINNDNNVRFWVDTNDGSFMLGINGRPYINVRVDNTGNKLSNPHLEEVPSGKYFIQTYYAVDAEHKFLSVMGGAYYDTIQEARIACYTEVLNTRNNWSVLLEMPALGAVIFQTDDSFTNANKTIALPFSTELHTFNQPYFDLRNEEYMVLPESKESIETVTYIDDYKHSSYNVYWGAWATDQQTNPEDIMGASKLYIHDTSNNGTDRSSEWLSVAIGSKVSFKTASNVYAVFQIDNVIDRAGYTEYDVTPIETNGTFENNVLTTAYKSSIASAIPTLEEVLESGDEADGKRIKLKVDGLDDSFTNLTGYGLSLFRAQGNYHISTNYNGHEVVLNNQPDTLTEDQALVCKKHLTDFSVKKQYNVTYKKSGTVASQEVLDIAEMTYNNGWYVPTNGSYRLKAITIDLGLSSVNQASDISLRVGSLSKESNSEYSYGSGSTVVDEVLISSTGAESQKYYRCETIEVDETITNDTILFTDLRLGNWIATDALVTLIIEED